MAGYGVGPQRAPLALEDKVLYGIAGIGNNTLFYGMTLWLLYFYAPPPGSELLPRVQVGLLGLILAAGRVLEALDDPLIGWWSDSARTRWGRRVPFMLLGTPLAALTFWLLWLPPVGAESLINAIFLFLMLEAFFLAHTVVGAPYDALQAEIAFTSRDRVSLSVWKVAFGSAGAAVALIGSPVLVAYVGFPGMGLTLALVFLATVYATLFGLWRRGTFERTRPARDAPLSPIAAIRTTLAHRPFLAFAASYVLFSLGFHLLAQLLPFYVRVTFGASEQHVIWYTAGLIGCVVLSLPAMSWGAARWGKRRMYALAMLALGLYLPALAILAFVPLLPGMSLSTQSLLAIWWTGVPFAALFVFPGALMADIIDDDALQTGHPRAALYYGVQATLSKFALAGAAGVLGILLQVFGSTPEQPFGIQLAGPVGGVCLLLGLLSFVLGYHLPDEPTQRP